ncbi:Competence-induced protein CinA [Syntrophomonas zehnderi OL-4]|uniref:Putative competence-damage inducible protein n=1 Tax=Syntrophomonas zehnderi OL-4 TaxID=690567 RepID=A0A0E4GBN7_9FIRM|nr:competence/damage-inducible protein A [Syntrophomonas zehnderi]CFX76160.1 Competence-induced protein CinA [Syntrophomonas zehnderi OL-4]
MQKVFLISTGTELLLGNTQDSNSVFLSRELGDMGLRVTGKATVGDSKTQIQKAFLYGLDLADIVISSGGLGPTFDDLTKTVASEVMGCKLELRSEEEARLREYFSRNQRKMPEINIKQAMFPPEAEVLKNSRGSAPGMYLAKNNKLIILLPGPPHEMQVMFKNEVKPRLERDYAVYMQRVVRRTIKVLGPGESRVEELLGELMTDTHGCSMALLATDGEIHIKLTAEGKDEIASQKILDELTEAIKGKLARHIFAYDDETLPQRVAGLLKEQGKQLAVAESCTGGMLGSFITDIPGSSEYFWGGAITYSNAAKIKILGVSPATLEEHGAVSRQTAAEMAQGIRQVSGADLGLSITGIAGPDGGSEAKPVGLVYIGLASADDCQVKELRYVGPRDAIRKLTTRSALDILRRHLEGIAIRL